MYFVTNRLKMININLNFGKKVAKKMYLCTRK